MGGGGGGVSGAVKTKIEELSLYEIIVPSLQCLITSVVSVGWISCQPSVLVALLSVSLQASLSTIYGQTDV